MIMTTITREVWVDAPKDKVWTALADFGNISIFNPTVPNSYLTSEQTDGVGTTRHCDLNVAGASVEERIVQWQDGKMMQIEIYAGKKTPPFKTALASISVKEEKGGTRVRGTFDYKMNYGPIGALMDAALIKSQFGKAWGGIFAGLKHYIETGEQVDSPKGLDFTPVAAVA
jgi:carbon monoxide dehydrogenase subunit G